MEVQFAMWHGIAHGSTIAHGFVWYCKGTPPIGKIDFFRALPKLPLPLPPIRASCTTFFGRQK